MLDLAVANDNITNSVSILQGNGDGTFTPLASLPTGSAAAVSITAGDFNGDGILDLAVALPTPNTLKVFLGVGNGTFTLISSPATGLSPWSVVAGDLNGDGILDLAAANISGNSITVLLGNGDGTFTANPQTPSTTSSPEILSMGDFNGDGRLDIVSPNFLGNVSVFLQAPELTATKTNDVGGIGTLAGWNWTIAVANSGSAAATFTTGQTILSDDLPNISISYVSPTVVNAIGVTGSIACTIVSSNLNCTASGGSVTLAIGASFGVKFSATPSVAGTFENPRFGASNKCAVDPNNNVTEEDETNNSCSNSVTMALANTMGANSGTTPQGVPVSTLFTNPLAVTVLNSSHNPVSGVNITFTAPSSGASGVFSNSTNTITVATNASGVASAPFTANATGGCYSATASAPLLNTVTFSLSNMVCVVSNPLIFQGGMQTLTTTLVNPYSGETININGLYNVNSTCSVDSGVTMQVIFSPSGTNTPQTGSISVPKKAGGLWFTSAWDGTRTVQKTLAGGSW